MSGLNDLLQLSGTGLRAYQNQINVFSNNIANVSTSGYSRRSLDLETGIPDDGLGTGVQSGEVSRLYNIMGRNALLQELPNAGYHTEMSTYLSDLESLIGGGTGGLDQALNDFETALQDAIASPEDLAARTVLLQSASSLASGLNQLDSALEKVDSLWGTTADTVDELNGLTAQLQDLNRNITRAESAGRSVPDLLDQRDQLVQELAAQANVAVSPDYRITLGGQELVSADGLNRQELTVDTANAFSVNGTDITSSVTGGKLAARVAAADTATALKNQINTLAETLISETNSVFDTAYNLKGERPADLGYTFFTGTDASDIAVDTNLYDPANPMGAHPERVALAATRASDGPPPVPNAGDNTAGLSLFATLDGSLSALNDQSLSGFLTQIETTLGGAVNEETQLAAGSASVVEMFDNQMLSVSGVNLDEELLNLMSAQKAYEACARVMSTASSLLDTLITLGR
ncbi:flagellar hook-associated protein FlgK [Pontiella agarivorans]|uniref:Flagellar hook-associated protein 1 n=1 Tax=Pontiella agarivorans TaxID=3038953 RepID=A0ABU5MT26_9BACT|nr:flagellar hook-associated protein FlgK [Pontiella agarivorans]MDZ8117303.1 flagellar hook-associated protein FlgK [Pontiella agarivorans]